MSSVSRTSSAEGRTSSSGRGRPDDISRRKSTDSAGSAGSAGRGRSVSSTGSKDLPEKLSRTPSAAPSGSSRSPVRRPSSRGAEAGPTSSLSRPTSAESTSSRGRRKSVSVDTLPKLFDDEPEFSRPRSASREKEEELEDELLAPVVEAGKEFEPQTPKAPGPIAQPPKTPGPLAQSRASFSSEDGTLPGSDSPLTGPHPGQLMPQKKGAPKPAVVPEKEPVQEAFLTQPAPPAEPESKNAWWYNEEHPSKNLCCFLLETVDIVAARMYKDGKVWVKVNSVSRLFPVEFARQPPFKTSGIIAIEKEWNVRVLDANFQNNEVELEVGECQSPFLMSGSLMVNLGICAGWRVLTGKGGYEEKYDSLILSHFFSQVVIELGYGYLRFRAGGDKPKVYFCTYEGTLKMDKGVSWARKPSTGKAPEYKSSFFAPKVVEAIEHVGPHSPYGGGDPITPKGIQIGCWAGNLNSSGVLRISNSNIHYISFHLEQDDLVDMKRMQDSLSRAAGGQGQAKSRAKPNATKNADGDWKIPISLLLSENGVALFRGKGDVCHEISGDGMKIMTKEQAGKAAVTFGGLDSRAGKWARTRMGEYEKTEKLKFKAEE